MTKRGIDNIYQRLCLHLSYVGPFFQNLSFLLLLRKRGIFVAVCCFARWIPFVLTYLPWGCGGIRCGVVGCEVVCRVMVAMYGSVRCRMYSTRCCGASEGRVKYFIKVFFFRENLAPLCPAMVPRSSDPQPFIYKKKKNKKTNLTYDIEPSPTPIHPHFTCPLSKRIKDFLPS